MQHTGQVIHARRGEDDNGAAAVEFALVVPLLIALVFGIIQFGILFAEELSLSNGARQGARVGAVDRTTCGRIVDEVQAAATTIGMPQSQIQVQVQVQASPSATPSTACAYTTSTADTTQPCLNSTDSARLLVTGKYTPSLNVVVSSTKVFPLQGTGVYRCEYSN